MPLDAIPPLGSWVIVYGQQAKVVNSVPAAARFSAAIQVEFPPEVDVPADLTPEPDPLSYVGPRCWVDLREPTLYTAATLMADLLPHPVILSGTAAEFVVLRAALESARLLLMDAGPQMSPALTVVDGFLDQLPASPDRDQEPS